MDKHTFYTQTYSHTLPSEENRDKLILNPYAQQKKETPSKPSKCFARLQKGQSTKALEDENECFPGSLQWIKQLAAELKKRGRQPLSRGESKSFFPLSTQMHSLPQSFLHLVSWVTSNGFKISTQTCYLHTNSSRCRSSNSKVISSDQRITNFPGKVKSGSRGMEPLSCIIIHSIFSLACLSMPPMKVFDSEFGDVLLTLCLHTFPSRFLQVPLVCDTGGFCP